MHNMTSLKFEVEWDAVNEEEYDVIGGIVTDVYDGNTFSILVIEEEYDNDYEYQKHEDVRIFGELAPELNTAGGREAADDLFEEIDGEEVMLCVYGRDKRGFLIAEYEVVD